MILLVQDRKNNLHLVDYTPASGNKYTICGRLYMKRDVMITLTLTTLALDNAVHNICRTCYEDYETMYGDDLKYDPRISFTSLHNKLLLRHLEVAKGVAAPEIKFQNLETRHWEKLNKYQRKTSRK
jgi:hypothetical protein